MVLKGRFNVSPAPPGSPPLNRIFRVISSRPVNPVKSNKVNKNPKKSVEFVNGNVNTRNKKVNKKVNNVVPVMKRLEYLNLNYGMPISKQYYRKYIVNNNISKNKNRVVTVMPNWSLSLRG